MGELEQSLRRPPSADPGPPARAFAERAEREGLVDVAYAFVPSPFGPLLAAATPAGLVRLAYEASPADAVLEQLAERVSPRVLEAPARLDPLRRELEEYFDGRRRDFDVPVDWRLSRGFFQAVLRAAARLPYGAVTTYARLAAEAGSPRAMRAAGNALASNPIPIVVPCHRIVRTGGALGGYGGSLGGYIAGIDVKRWLLEHEGALDREGRAP